MKKAKTSVVLLGTGNPKPDPAHAAPALAVVVNDRAYVFDAGPGVVGQAKAAFLRHGIEALKPEHLERVFLTHLHSDHTLGLPDIIYTPWVMNREVPLDIYGPSGTRAMVTHIQKAYIQDVHVRTHGLERNSKTGWKTRVHEIKPGLVYTDEFVRISAFRVKHGIWKHAFGYKVVTADKTIVISGDTSPCAELIKQARGCDILVHEVYAAKKFKTFPKNWQKYCRTFHTSGPELAKIAKVVKPGILVLTHLMPFGGVSYTQILREVRAGYTGKTILGKDLQIVR